MYRNALKRVLDFGVALAVLIVFGPVLLLCMALVAIDSRGPVFYNQERLGRHGKLFKVFKLRTMTDKPRTVHTEVLKGNAEITRVGGVLRRTKLDELPQILNVLRGEMSLVGPRPGLPTQLSEFNEDGKKRLEVRPGLTGLAQVNGNIFLSWPERWAYDRRYVERLSLGLDLGILLKTILIVILGEERFTRKPVPSATDSGTPSSGQS
ncbi:sugar transferase [bacterium]|nr:sugar transferase [bacterium]